MKHIVIQILLYIIHAYEVVLNDIGKWIENHLFSSFGIFSTYLQGGQDPNLKLQTAITQKLNISDPSLVKPI